MLGVGGRREFELALKRVKATQCRLQKRSSLLMLVLAYCFEQAVLPVLSYFTRFKTSPIHCDINTGAKGLNESKSTAKIKQTIRTTKLIRYHRAR
jgi:hypothetical protein